MYDHATFYTTLAKNVCNMWFKCEHIRTLNPKVVVSNPAPATSPSESNVD